MPDLLTIIFNKSLTFSSFSHEFIGRGLYHSNFWQSKVCPIVYMTLFCPLVLESWDISSTISTVLIPTHNILSKLDLYLWMVRAGPANQIGKNRRIAICDLLCSMIKPVLMWNRTDRRLPSFVVICDLICKSRPLSRQIGRQKGLTQVQRSVLEVMSTISQQIGMSDLLSKISQQIAAHQKVLCLFSWIHRPRTLSCVLFSVKKCVL